MVAPRLHERVHAVASAESRVVIVVSDLLVKLSVCAVVFMAAVINTTVVANQMCFIIIFFVSLTTGKRYAKPFSA